jgi:hypothetical protein
MRGRALCLVTVVRDRRGRLGDLLLGRETMKVMDERVHSMSNSCIYVCDSVQCIIAVIELLANGRRDGIGLSLQAVERGLRSGQE